MVMADPGSLIPLLHLLSDPWRHYVVSSLLFMGGMTVVVTILKSIVPMLRSLATRTATDRDDVAVSIMSEVIDMFADLVEWCQRFAEVLAAHRAPPIKAVVARVRKSSPVMAFTLMAVMFAPNHACAGHQVRTHAQIADALYGPIIAAKQAIELRAYQDVAHIRAASLTTDEANSKIALLRERYQPVEVAMGLLIDGHNEYVDAIQKAHTQGTGLRTDSGLALLSRWMSLARTAEAIGIRIAEAPEELREISR